MSEVNELASDTRWSIICNRTDLPQANGPVFILTQSVPPSPPLVSVIMPAFNTEAWIAEAIDSVLQQTFEDFEFIIVDDGSTDNTAHVVRSYTDPRIVFVENGQNIGISESLNHAMSIAKGKYLARMDADDICVSERLQLQTEFMENNPDIGISGGYHSVFGQGVRKPGTRYFPLSPADVLDWMLRDKSLFSHPTVIIRKSIFLAGYRYEGGNGGEDDRLWNKAFFGKIRMTNIPHVLVYHRRHSRNNSSRGNPNYAADEKRNIESKLAFWWSLFRKSGLKRIQEYDSPERFVQANNGFVLGRLSEFQTDLPSVLQDYRWSKEHSLRILRLFLKHNIADIHWRFGERVSATVLLLFLKYRIKTFILRQRQAS